jgi:hypothetical protein
MPWKARVNLKSRAAVDTFTVRRSGWHAGCYG